MANKIQLLQLLVGDYQDWFVEHCCATEEYRRMCASLHERYKDKMVQGAGTGDLSISDYPEEYWVEFNEVYDEIMKAESKKIVAHLESTFNK